jgi:hypothetical protein
MRRGLLLNHGRAKFSLDKDDLIGSIEALDAEKLAENLNRSRATQGTNNIKYLRDEPNGV